MTEALGPSMVDLHVDAFFRIWNHRILTNRSTSQKHSNHCFRGSKENCSNYLLTKK